MADLETTRFPDCIAYGSVFTPFWNTTHVVLGSGHEKSNANWANPKTRANVATGVKRHEDLEDLLDFFHAVRGSHGRFRIKNHIDYNSAHTGDTVSATDQTIGTGDGVTTAFQLKKTYTVGGFSNYRNIYKPVSGTVRASVNNVETLLFSVDTTTGIITFNAAPGNGLVVKAGFQYDLRARFETDELPIDLSHYLAGQVQVGVIEVRLGA